MEVESEKSSVRDICSKVKKLKLTDVFQLNLAIDQLNALNCSDFSEENKEYEELLCTLSNLIPSGNDHMLSKFCCLIKLSLQKRKIILHNSSFECLLKMMISAVHSSAEWVLNDVLQTISALFETNVEQVTNFCDDLIGKNGALTKFLLPSNHEKSIIFDAYQCLLSLMKNLCENGYQGEAFDFCFQKCFLVIKDKFMCSVTDIMILKIVLSSLKCLQYAFLSKNLKIENFGELLGTLKNFLFYGLPGQTFTSDINLYPTLRYPPDGPHNQESQSESDSPHPKLRKQKKSKRRHKKASNKRQFHNEPEVDEGSDYMTTDLCENLASVSLSSSSKIISETKGRNSSSDSEISDAENYISQLKPLQVAIRRNAYLALLNVIKITDKKVMFGYWSYFLPEHPVIPGLISSPNIFTSVLKDPAPRVRLNALSLLAEMLRGSKQFLMHADGRNARHTSFTSLSSILATMISEIHRYLLLALVSENSSLILTQILKCYAVLAENVPYSKLDRKIILKFLVHIKSYLFHKDLHVRVACIAVFCSVVNSDQTPAEIEDLMLLSDFENTVDILNASSQNNVNPSQTSMFPTSEESPWIVKICDNNIRGDEPLPIKIQSLLLLSSIAGKYFQKSLSFFKVLDNIVVVSLSHPDKSVQLHGAKLLDMLGRSMNIVTDMDFKKKFQPLMSALWQNILKDALIKCLANDDVKILRPVCCDCLSTLPSKDFEELPHKLQIAYITILLGLASDSNPNVRGAAIRCLGLFCLFPSLTEDPCFLDDVSDILVKSVEDPNVNVRFKASWSLGNLSDALFLNKDKFLFNKEISSKFFYSMGMACVQFSKDCDRVKANAVRALGNLLNYIPVEFINLKMMQEFIKESCEVLTSALSSNFMKVCWNSCYALGNMFRNTYLIENSALNLEEVYSCLLKVLKSSNFKVRISAAQALTTLTSRKFYGKLLPVIWHELLSALFSTSLDVNFKEIKHQENLRDQLCLSLCQLAILITSEDMTAIKNETLEAQEILLISMWKFGSRMSEEKSIILRDAIDNVTSLTATVASNDVDPGVMVLLDILNQASIAFYSQEGS
ncbi:HEAT repeat-containing protein 6 [Trichonephila clavata]|uniref:HEAT repeat-containing protein 6 n=1 Tax=Trichonephila clavata TaxID=2740835 RepID=A0A8X6IEB2_TRICU|nr:HEAT repeat-containing protein 6 [Trichonephila clavata]